MHKKHDPAFRLPQLLADDTTLDTYAKQLALTMFSLADQQTGILCKSQRYLAKASGMSTDTVNKHLKNLERAGYIEIKKQKSRFNKEKGHPTGRASVYVCIIPKTGYLLIPYCLLHRMRSKGIKGARLAVFLCIYRYIRNGRAYPSRTMIARKTGLSDSTVDEALEELDSVNLLYRQQCKKQNGAFSCNSYFLLQPAAAPIPVRQLSAYAAPKKNRGQHRQAYAQPLVQVAYLHPMPDKGQVRLRRRAQAHALAGGWLYAFSIPRIVTATPHGVVPQPIMKRENKRAALTMKNITIGSYTLEVNTENPAAELLTEKLERFLNILTYDNPDIRYYIGGIDAIIAALYFLNAISREQFRDENRTNAFFKLQDNLAAHTTAHSAPKRHPRPDNLPEDAAWSSTPYPDEEQNPYVYTGDMTPQDYALMHEQRLVHSAPADRRSDTLER